MANAPRDENRVTTLLGVSSSDGTTPTKVEITAATGRTRVDSLATNTSLDIAKGNVPGTKCYTIVGRKNQISATVLDDISQIPSTTVLPVGGGIQMEVVSTSDEDSDTGGSIAQGSGARTVFLHYLDSTGAELTETIIMDGTNPVNTNADDIDEVQWLHVKTVGGNANGTAVGAISLRNTAGSVVYEYIAAGGNQSLSCRYTVPLGTTGYILGWQASGVTKRIDVRLRATVEKFDRSLVPGVFLFQDAMVLSNTASGWIPFEVPLKVPAGGRIKASAIGDVTGGDAGIHFTILIVDN